MSVRNVIQAAAGAGGADKLYVEDVFSTYLYSGNGSTQTITNGIDLAGEGGLVWTKIRNLSSGHNLFNTARGAGKAIDTSSTSSEYNDNYVTAFNADGFTGTPSSYNFASWTFRKAKKFFDVVTYTGNGTAGRTVSHNLGSTPGCIIVKRTDTTGSWATYHRSVDATSPQNYVMYLNLTNGSAAASTVWNNTAPTSTEFTVGTSNNVNASGGTYVAYLFAHDAGGFGDAGDQSVIKCGSFTTDGSANFSVTLDWEPQWVLYKSTSGAGPWYMLDTMRGYNLDTTNGDNYLLSNSSNAEAAGELGSPTATGFVGPAGAVSTTYIYIAIRRGPMKTPESGTEVFYPYVTSSVSSVGSATTPMYNSQIITDLAWQKDKNNTDGWFMGTRLTGTGYVKSEASNVEATSPAVVWDSNRGTWSWGSSSYGLYCFKRAPEFLDVVCYNGTGSNTTVAHNLGVAPEFIVVKCRNVAEQWATYQVEATKYMRFNTTAGAASSGLFWNNTAPTASVFSVGADGVTNGSGQTYEAWLFASVPGVSKVGTYTGNNNVNTITTGFIPRFILIKRYDSTGAWYVYDTVRGITSGSDPYLLLNSADGEVAGTNYINVTATGFVLDNAPAALNANGGTFFYLAIS